LNSNIKDEQRRAIIVVAVKCKWLKQSLQDNQESIADDGGAGRGRHGRD
jgi:hypothetical protein